MENMKIKNECAICDTKIREFDVLKNKLKKTPEYNEITVKLNDLSNMKVAVCSKHLKPNKLQLATIMDKTQKGWLEELALGIGNKQWVMNIGSKLKVISLVKAGG